MWWLVGLAWVPSVRPASLTLHADRSHALDLPVSGELEGLAPGQVAYVRIKDLQALPSRLLATADHYLAGKQNIKIVMLADLWAALPRRTGADALVSDCADGYASVFPAAFIERQKPFLVLEIDGRTLDAWAELGFTFNAGPFIISVSEEIAPGVMALRDIGHKQPWGVNRIAVVSSAAYFASLPGAGPAPSPLIAQGREIWINSCFSCHPGPDGRLGGTKSGVSFGVLKAYAANNKPYFKHYIRNPVSLRPTAKMEPHPHYTEDELKALISFMVATNP